MGDAPRCAWGGKYVLRKVLTRLTGSLKTVRTPIIRASCARREPAEERPGVCPLGAKRWGRPAPSLRLSLPHRRLVNSASIQKSGTRLPAIRVLAHGERQRGRPGDARIEASGPVDEIVPPGFPYPMRPRARAEMRGTPYPASNGIASHKCCDRPGQSF